jgi:hypothetical protein
MALSGLKERQATPSRPLPPGGHRPGGRALRLERRRPWPLTI